MRPAEVARRGAAYLARHGVDAPETNAEQLLLSVLGVDRAALRVREAPLTGGEAKAFGRALCRRCAGTPLQHLTGEQGFRYLILEVRPGVFVPRPETEVLVDVVLQRLSGIREPVVVDVCTGTGAVALAVKDERPDARVWAADVSTEAIALARDNAVRLGLDVAVVEGDLLMPLPRDLYGAVDLIACNPPYVPEDRAPDLPAEVRADPPLAVFGGPPIYERLFAEAAGWLRPGGSVCVEIEESTAEVVGGLALAAGFEEVEVRKDLAGRDRVVAARRP